MTGRSLEGSAFGTGASVHTVIFVIPNVVTGRINHVRNVALATGLTGIGGIAVISTSRLGNYSNVIVALCRFDINLGFVTDLALITNHSAALAVCRSNVSGYDLPIVSAGFAVFRGADRTGRLVDTGSSSARASLGLGVRSIVLTYKSMSAVALRIAYYVVVAESRAFGKGIAALLAACARIIVYSRTGAGRL